MGRRGSSCRPFLLGFGRVLGHECAQLRHVIISFLKPSLQPIKEPAIAKNPNAKRGRADAGLGAVIINLLDQGIMFHGPLFGQMSSMCQGQLANRLKMNVSHDRQHV